MTLGLSPDSPGIMESLHTVDARRRCGREANWELHLLFARFNVRLCYTYGIIARIQIYNLKGQIKEAQAKARSAKHLIFFYADNVIINGYLSYDIIRTAIESCVYVF
jgi:hypothetical protein